jgi:hypothetical protein
MAYDQGLELAAQEAGFDSFEQMLAEAKTRLGGDLSMPVPSTPSDQQTRLGLDTQPNMY